jgi:hypothetical protein
MRILLVIAGALLLLWLLQGSAGLGSKFFSQPQYRTN